jgi:hypothetical protein
VPTVSTETAFSLAKDLIIDRVASYHLVISHKAKEGRAEGKKGSGSETIYSRSGSELNK